MIDMVIVQHEHQQKLVSSVSVPCEDHVENEGLGLSFGV
jgi:hypothetical protein